MTDGKQGQGSLGCEGLKGKTVKGREKVRKASDERSWEIRGMIREERGRENGGEGKDMGMER